RARLQAQRALRPRRGPPGVTPRARAVGVAAALAVALALPLFVSNFRLFQFTQVAVYAIALLGLNVLTGYNGQISLGHGAFYALGAYTTAIMIDKWDVPYPLTIVTAGVLCLVVGFLFGIPALRLEGLYLALATFALALAIPQILKYFEHWTGGSQGIVLSKPAPPWGMKASPDQWLYYFTLAVLVILFVLARNLLAGRTGRAIVVIGGLASISGAIFGALFIQFVPNWAQDISKAAPWAIYGVFLIGFMYVMPFGIAGALRRVAARAARRGTAARA